MGVVWLIGSTLEDRCITKSLLALSEVAFVKLIVVAGFAFYIEVCSDLLQAPATLTCVVLGGRHAT